ncbi:sensor histidine kinase [Longispora urticae]
MSGERVDSWLRRHPTVVDVVLAVGVAVLGVVVASGDPWSVVCAAVLPLPLAARRRQPVVCAALVLPAAFGQWLAIPHAGLLASDLAVLMAIHAAAGYGPRWAGRAGLAAGLLGAALAGVRWPLRADTSSLQHLTFAAFLGSTAVTAWALGALHRVRRERARLVEIERGQQARLTISAERARIAREMHDVVAHSLAVVIVQADGGWFAAESSPQAARASLATIGDTGRRAMGEMRRLLGVLREGQDGEQSSVPQPGFTDISQLVEETRASGLDVHLRLDQPGEPVEPGLGLVVYRIVQEGLTNVLKHAGQGARAQVAVRWDRDQLEIVIQDDGRGTTICPSSAGHGVVGMRERVAAYGGTVWLGPSPGGGHLVRARIPVLR